MGRAAIDTTALLKLVLGSLAAGVSVAVVFSLAILGAARSAEMRRAGRSRSAAAFAALGGLGLLLTAAIVLLGLILVVRKR